MKSECIMWVLLSTIFKHQSCIVSDIFVRLQCLQLPTETTWSNKHCKDLLLIILLTILLKNESHSLAKYSSVSNDPVCSLETKKIVFFVFL